MTDHSHLRQATNICCFHGPLVRSKNSNSHLNLFVRYSSFRILRSDWSWGFWTITQKLDFSQICCFCKKLTLDTWHLLTEENKHIYLWGYYFCCNPKDLIFGTFWALWAHLNFFPKIRICHLSYFIMFNFMGKKTEKKWWSRDFALQAYGKTNKAKFIRHFLLGWVSTFFAPSRRYRLSVAR